jgi:hypothetical protein
MWHVTTLSKMAGNGLTGNRSEYFALRRTEKSRLGKENKRI